jgi:hypothetical protein
MIYLIFSVLFCVLAYFAKMPRTTFLVITALLLSANFFIAGYPRVPLRMYNEVPVAAFLLDPNGGHIYIWTEGLPPMSYRIPWNDEVAERMQSFNSPHNMRVQVTAEGTILDTDPPDGDNLNKP